LGSANILRDENCSLAEWLLHYAGGEQYAHLPLLRNLQRLSVLKYRAEPAIAIRTYSVTLIALLFGLDALTRLKPRPSTRRVPCIAPFT
jgi:hypothetical protein